MSKNESYPLAPEVECSPDLLAIVQSKPNDLIPQFYLNTELPLVRAETNQADNILFVGYYI